jgi:hypothetical protein
MEFGVFHAFPSVPGHGETEMFDEGMEQVDIACSPVKPRFH